MRKRKWLALALAVLVVLGILSIVEYILEEQEDLRQIQETIGPLSDQGSAPPAPAVTQPPVQPASLPSLQLEPYAGGRVPA